jgi:hypothetical protein
MLKGFRNLWRRANKTAIDDSSSLTPIGRDEFEYREGAYLMTIYAELCRGEVDRIVDASSIHQWRSPHDNEAIDAAKKRDILRIVVESFEKSGKKVIINNRESWCSDG